MSGFLRIDADWSKWADKLRAIYASLPDSARQQMLSTGWYSFKLSDLPKDQQQIMTDFCHHDKNVSGVISPDCGTKCTDLQKLTFSFGRQAPSEKSVRIRIFGPNGGPQPEFASWPTTTGR